MTAEETRNGSGRRRSRAPRFSLVFPKSQIRVLAGRYENADEPKMIAAGEAIAAGRFGPSHLREIFEWKTRGRGRTRLDANDRDEVEDALRLARRARTERAAISVLTGLNGVGVPVASAVMTAIDPDRFTIIDFRALFSLGVEQDPPYSVPFYLAYLAACRRIAGEAGVSLRTLDKALWKYSEENQPPGSSGRRGSPTG